MIKKAGLILMLLMFIPAIVSAEEAGLIAAIKGKVIILRDAKTINAILKDKIFLKDTVETREASRTKMLFRDDSILTLAENSKVNIKEYLYSEDKKGKSIFNLVDGKLRSLVGNSEFEVHTPTMAAAARGTYFITYVGIEEGISVSGVAVLEGFVDVININPAIVGVVRLGKGTMSKVFENRLPTPSAPTPPALLKELLNTTELQSIPEPEKTLPLPERKTVEQPAPSPVPVIEHKAELPLIPPIVNQTPPNTTPVIIRIPIPEGL
ncbi:MAG: hypothetical protein EPN88_05775 [Bacteroidetes bacterium]|nr:MAG: hypothetical protein EPN88_05775 [Bacteroidota bacterium]